MATLAYFHVFRVRLVLCFPLYSRFSVAMVAARRYVSGVSPGWSAWRQSWDMGSSEVIQRCNSRFEAGQERRRTETRRRDSMKLSQDGATIAVSKNVSHTSARSILDTVHFPNLALTY